MCIYTQLYFSVSESKVCLTLPFCLEAENFIWFISSLLRHFTSNAKEAEVEWFYEDLRDLLELTPQKDVLFTIGDWNAKVGSQETPWVTGKFSLGIRNEAGQRLKEFCQRTHWS